MEREMSPVTIDAEASFLATCTPYGQGRRHGCGYSPTGEDGTQQERTRWGMVRAKGLRSSSRSLTPITRTFFPLLLLRLARPTLLAPLPCLAARRPPYVTESPVCGW